MKTYAEELLHEGRQEGRLGTIENFLRAGVEWSVITEATGIDQEAFRALRRGSKSRTRPTGSATPPPPATTDGS